MSASDRDNTVDSQDGGPTSTPDPTLDETTFDDPTLDGSGTTGTKLDVPEPVCAVSDLFECAAGVDCRQWDCGSVLSPFDASGCMRPRCEGQDCPAGMECIDGSQWGGCTSSALECDLLDDGTCQCGGARPDCGASWCVPAEQAPPAPCVDFGGDSQMCIDAGCDALLGRQIVANPDGACLCDEFQTFCGWLEPGTRVLDEPGVYLALTAFDQVVVLETATVPPPLGWIPCAELPGNPACACADVLPCAM
jgi:hypothetical protein